MAAKQNQGKGPQAVLSAAKKRGHRYMVGAYLDESQPAEFARLLQLAFDWQVEQFKKQKGMGEQHADG